MSEPTNRRRPIAPGRLPASRRPRRHARRPRLEPLEGRALLTTITVTNLDDSGAGSLRAAIEAANDETTNPGADTIRFDASLAGGTITLTTSRNDQTGIFPGPTALVASSTIAIEGSGQVLQRVGNFQASPKFRLFFVTSAANLTLKSLTLRGGWALGGGNNFSSGGGGAGLGGAAFNQGTLNLEGVTAAANTAEGGEGTAGVSRGGAGLGGDGSFNSGGPNGGTSSSPNGGFGGGGFAGGDGGFGGGGGGEGGDGGFGGGGGGNTDSGGPFGQGGFGAGDGGFASDSFFDYGVGGGGAGLGGAIFNDQGGVLTITNSTLAGNTARGGRTFASLGSGAGRGSGFGGAVFNRNGTVTIRSSTLAGNTVAAGAGGSSGTSDGGAVYSLLLDGSAASLTLQNSILANSAGGNDLVNNSGTVTGSSNLVESQTGAPSGVISLTSDPKLGALQPNGGPTPTMALATDSPALNAGDNALLPAGLTTDQRGAGFPRIFNTRVDLGAFELTNSAPTGLALSNASVAENQPIGTAVGTFSTTDPDAGNTFTYALVGGIGSTDNASFAIVGGQLRTAASFDYEAKSSYSIRVRTTDQGGLSFERSFTVTVNNVNDAPVLDNTKTFSLATINEDDINNRGTLVSAIIASAGSNGITDQDAGALRGIAVTAVNNSNGTWQYTINGGSNWTSFGSPAEARARLLAADTLTRIRFVPSHNFNGTVTNGITFRAWDRTSGTNGGTGDASVRGDTAAFSALTATAGIQVLSPQQQIDIISGQVQGLTGLSKGQRNSLLVPLDNAKRKLDAGQVRPAISLLQDFIANVRDLIRGNVISTATGQPLIDEANAVIASANV